jgi:hypothetical protein
MNTSKYKRPWQDLHLWSPLPVTKHFGGSYCYYFELHITKNINETFLTLKKQSLNKIYGFYFCFFGGPKETVTVALPFVGPCKEMLHTDDTDSKFSLNDVFKIKF